MLYELRIYTIPPGRMQAMLNRFRDDTIRIFARYDMKVTEFWVDADESKNRLYYVLEHRDAEARERNFEAFMNDPEWLAVRAKTEQDGPLYEHIDIVYMHKAPFFKAPEPNR
ncbi:NIPSNAP family protein [Paenibacillus sp. MWE-103]|uniref:NIPSNAP family protein n=1 Tax=Paenibacillus artemisiicola TaxID=1172618 RepID=A0ABS3W3A4_9BACL|nr:NIPSNAP family protein [Paenibacillus artemisiicola]MBO7742784.1 NIPSNAP family protein [Paenibacillus artemisiicola]